MGPLAALQDVAQSTEPPPPTPSVLQRRPTDGIGHEVPPPPPEQE